MDRLLDATSETRRKKARRQRLETPPGPEHLETERFFAYAQAQLGGPDDAVLDPLQRRAIAEHLLDCEACLHDYLAIEGLVAQRLATPPRENRPKRKPGPR